MRIIGEESLQFATSRYNWSPSVLVLSPLNTLKCVACGKVRVFTKLFLSDWIIRIFGNFGGENLNNSGSSPPVIPVQPALYMSSEEGLIS
jgi:hypothetical protein